MQISPVEYFELLKQDNSSLVRNDLNQRLNIANASPDEIFKVLESNYRYNTSEELAFVRCNWIQEYMKHRNYNDYDNYKLVHMFFACGNGNYFRKEIECYFKCIGCVDGKKVALEFVQGKNPSIDWSGGCQDVLSEMCNNVRDHSVKLFEYLFTVVEFNQEELQWFLTVAIRENQCDMVKFLLDHVDDINSVYIDAKKDTKNLDMLTILLNSGRIISPDTVDFLKKKNQEISTVLKSVEV
jgi:hypothetical protein